MVPVTVGPQLGSTTTLLSKGNYNSMFQLSGPSSVIYLLFFHSRHLVSEPLLEAHTETKRRHGVSGEQVKWLVTYNTYVWQFDIFGKFLPDQQYNIEASSKGTRCRACKEDAEQLMDP